MNGTHNRIHACTRTHTSIHMANKQVLIRLSWRWGEKVAHITRQLGAQLKSNIEIASLRCTR